MNFKITRVLIRSATHRRKFKNSGEAFFSRERGWVDIYIVIDTLDFFVGAGSGQNNAGSGWAQDLHFGLGLFDCLGAYLVK
jgi:hypothetical protein